MTTVCVCILLLCRHWGIRVVIPPGAVTQPTRINCKYQPLAALPFPPPFMEREALASRVLEISPALQSFRSPVLLEIPHFASAAAGEREIVVLRSNDGENWSEHISDTVDDTQIYQVLLQAEKLFIYFGCVWKELLESVIRQLETEYILFIHVFFLQH
jgi:hypothetical protein